MEAGGLFQNPGSWALLPSHLLCFRSKGSQQGPPCTSCHTSVATLPAPALLHDTSSPAPSHPLLASRHPSPLWAPGACSCLTSRKATPATYDLPTPATTLSLLSPAQLLPLQVMSPPTLPQPAPSCHLSALHPTAGSPPLPETTPPWSLPPLSVRGLSSKNRRDWSSSGHQSVTRLSSTEGLWEGGEAGEGGLEAFLG